MNDDCIINQSDRRDDESIAFIIRYETLAQVDTLGYIRLLTNLLVSPLCVASSTPLIEISLLTMLLICSSAVSFAAEDRQRYIRQSDR
jgi:hypothetical protein